MASPNSPRIYLDHAATTWPKPESVYRAMDAFGRNVGVAGGRGSHGDAIEAARVVAHARSLVARLVGAADPSHVLFTSGGTASLNMAIHGLLRAGDHVVTTVTEHNSVLRPLHFQHHANGVEITYVDSNATGFVPSEAILGALRPTTRLVVINHVSNVTGTVQPFEPVASELAHRDTFLLLDAAQSLGHVPLDVSTVPVDLIAAPGHKGLLGPLGTGILYVAPRVADQLQPIMQGGTGTDSESEHLPSTWPSRFEPGSHNSIGIAGLAAGVEYLLEATVEQIANSEIVLGNQLLEGVGETNALQLQGPPTMAGRLGVFSLVSEQLDPHEVASLLESSFGIQTRAGLHCAPRIHRRLGNHHGSLRVSIGATSRESDIDAFLGALSQLSFA